MKLILDGLCCPNCAAKIERATGQLKEVHSCSINFANTTMLVEPNAGVALAALKPGITDVVLSIEPDVKIIAADDDAIAAGWQRRDDLHGHGHCSCGHDHDHEHEHGHHDHEHDHHDHSHSHDDHAHDHSHEHSGTGSGEGGLSEAQQLMISFIGGAALLAAAVFVDASTTLTLVLYLAAYVVAGYDVLWRSLRNISRGQVFDENFLMSVATIGALAIGEYPEAVAVMLFYKAGEFFQSLAVSRSRRSISELMDIRPEYATLVQGGSERRVSPEAVKAGNVILVKPGEKVPLDGVVIEGTAALDTSALTGESLPRDVKQGDEVLSGSINKSGLLRIEVTKAYSESAVAKILHLVEEAGNKKAPTESFITKFAAVYTPAVVGVAVLLAIVPPLLLGFDRFSEFLYMALTFLVVSCPCAVVISVPLSFFGGIGGASRRGILTKGGNYLEALNQVETVVFDKTGTLTKGKFEVTELVPQGRHSESELLRYAALAESFSSHPIARSIVAAYDGIVDKDLVTDYKEVAGHGISAKIGGRQVLAGNAKLMGDNGITEGKNSSGGTVVHVAADGEYLGYIVVADVVKEDAASAVKQLKELGVKRTVMLTGDNEQTAKVVAQRIGIDECHYELLPQDKVTIVEQLSEQQSGKAKLAFVGDGINDAPVLARADIGIAMGGVGSDAAVEAADVVIMTDEPSKIATAIRIAKKTRRVVTQNIALALIVKLVVMVLTLTGHAIMWAAVIADVGVALVAVLNAMRVLDTKGL